MKCPNCGSKDTEHRAQSERLQRDVYYCKGCNKRFIVDEKGARLNQ